MDMYLKPDDGFKLGMGGDGTLRGDCHRRTIIKGDDGSYDLRIIATFSLGPQSFVIPKRSEESASAGSINAAGEQQIPPSSLRDWSE